MSKLKLYYLIYDADKDRPSGIPENGKLVPEPLAQKLKVHEYGIRGDRQYKCEECGHLNRPFQEYVGRSNDADFIHGLTLGDVEGAKEMYEALTNEEEALYIYLYEA